MKRKQMLDLMRIALRNGATVTNGKKHFKVYAADGHYVCSFSHGSGGFEGRHDGKWYFNRFRKEGWL